MHDKLHESYHEKREDVITLLIALQHQNFLMGNSLTNLVKKWPQPPKAQPTINEDLSMFGILLDNRT